MFRLTEFRLARRSAIARMGRGSGCMSSCWSDGGTRVLGEIAVVMTLVVSTACVESTGPVARNDLVIVGGGELNSIAAVSVSRGEVAARIGPIPRYKDMFALAPDSSRLYISSFDNSSPVTLTVVDTRSLRVVAQERMSAIAARSRVGPVLPLGGYGMAVSPDGNKLIVNGLRGDSGAWLQDSARVLVILDAASLTPVGVVGPFKIPADGIVSVPGPADGASQRVMVLGGPPGATVLPSRVILVLGGPDLLVVDSIQLGVPVYRLVPIGSRGMALLFSARSVYLFDITKHALVDSAPRVTGSGGLCLAPDGRLYQTDSGDGIDTPGSGQVQVYTSSLELLPPIDLRPGLAASPTLNGCAVSHDGRLLLVSSGTASLGPTFTPQPGRLFEVDRSTGRLLRIVDIGDWLSREVFAF